MTQCARPTRAGRPCKNAQLAAGGFFTTASYAAPACNSHLTPDERSEYSEHAAAIRADDVRLEREFHGSLPVKCWDWPVTDEDMCRAAEARACPDPEQARLIAWNLLADWQGSRCAICGGRSRFLDHSHGTGLVRGWLCHGCNIGEGFTDVPGGQFDRYRQKNPASILGIEIRYFSPFTGWAEPDPGPAGIDLDRSPGYLLASYLTDEGQG